MNIRIAATQNPPKKYIVDQDTIKETDRAIGLPVGVSGNFPVVSTLWFPKKCLSITSLGNKRVEVIIPSWLMGKKHETGELLDGYDIVTTF